MRKRLYSIIIVVLVTLLSGCNNDPNNNHDCIPGTANKVQAENIIPTKVVSFIEVSGSMSGYYAGNDSTQFKKDVWRILSKLEKEWKTDSITLLSDQKPFSQDINTFRKRMHAGNIPNEKATFIPEMLNGIVTQVDTMEEMVAILISDMKYSPVGSSSPQALMADYATDILNLFDKKSLAVSLICAVSDFKNSKCSCSQSPYYYLIIGNPNRVVEVRNSIVDILQDSGTFIDVIENGVNYGEKILANHDNAKGIMVLDKNGLKYGGYDSKVTDTITITLRVDLSPYPPFMRNADTLLRYSSITKSGFSSCIIDKAELVSKDEANLTLKVYDFREKSQTVTLKIQGYDPSLPREVRQFFGAKKESECDKTLSIEQFIQGIHSKHCPSSSLDIFITKEDKI